MEIEILQQDGIGAKGTRIYAHDYTRLIPGITYLWTTQGRVTQLCCVMHHNIVDALCNIS